MITYSTTKHNRTIIKVLKFWSNPTILTPEKISDVCVNDFEKSLHLPSVIYLMTLNRT